MCTVVTRWSAGEPVRLLGIRDELESRAFDEPGEWWPDQPGVIGGRDRRAGGTWCASRIADARTAVVLNRPERRTGTPSRGLLPLAALEHGGDWPAHVDYRDMASFTLLLAMPDGVWSWEWDARTLRERDDLTGTHFVTSHGVDPGDQKARRYAAGFLDAESTRAWPGLVADNAPADDLAALVVRHPVDAGEGADEQGDHVAGDAYATVFGQLIEARPGRLHIGWSRTPWLAAGWSERTWAR